MKVYIKLLILIMWMTIIFLFSTQTGAQSSKSSQFIIDILNFLHLDINSFFGRFTEFVVRKSAHMFEYFVLCLLIYYLVKDYLSYKVIISIFFSFLYACTDEAHQLFVPNRGPSFHDVLIDTSGAIIAMCILYFIKKIKKSELKS